MTDTTPQAPTNPEPPTTPSTPQPTEKDVMALKGRAEKAEGQLKEAQTAHKTALEAAANLSNEEHQRLLQAEAKVQGLEEKMQESAGSATELAEVKQKLEAAEKSRDELTGRALEYRKAIIVAAYNIPADTIKDKSMVELDNYEEALKSVVASRSAGNYALGGGGGGAATPRTPVEQAGQELAIARAQQTKRRAGGVTTDPDLKP